MADGCYFENHFLLLKPQNTIKSKTGLFVFVVKATAFEQQIT